MFLFANAPDGSHPPPPITRLGIDEPLANAKELGSAAIVPEQDTDNLMRIQRGLRASKKPGVTLAAYQEGGCSITMRRWTPIWRGRSLRLERTPEQCTDRCRHRCAGQ